MRKLGVVVAVAVGVLALTSSAGAFAGANGKILFLSNRSGDREIYLMNRDGTDVTRLTFNNLFERAATWSRDGTKIAFAGRSPDGNFDIYTINANGSALQRLTTDPARDDDPAWTADGSQILYDRGLFTETVSIRIVNADGTNDRALDVGPGDNFAPETAPHGDRIVFASDRTGIFDLYTTSLNGGPVRQITSDSGFDFDPRWSPTGNDIAFLRDNGTGDNDLYVVHANGTGLHQLTATPSLVEFGPAWAPDGSEILFFSTSGGPTQLYAMSPAGGAPTRLSTTPKAPLDETFEDGVVDSSLWHVISDPGGTIGEVNGRLEAAISGAAVPGGQYNQVDEHIGSQCTLNADFDFQVDYALVTWPPHNGFFAMLNAIFADGAIARTSATWDPPYDEQYNAWTSGPPFTFDTLNTTDTSGQLRLVRQNGVQYAYERGGGSEWTLVHSGTTTGNAVAAMGLWAPASTFAHQDGLVAYDNFRLNSGELTCPEWWADAWPDWQALPVGD